MSSMTESAAWLLGGKLCGLTVIYCITLAAVTLIVDTIHGSVSGRRGL